MIERFLVASPELKLKPFINPLDQALGNGALRINPWDGPCNGMFIARITRQA